MYNFKVTYIGKEGQTVKRTVTASSFMDALSEVKKDLHACGLYDMESLMVVRGELLGTAASRLRLVPG